MHVLRNPVLARNPPGKKDAVVEKEMLLRAETQRPIPNIKTREKPPPATHRSHRVSIFI